MSNQIKLVIAKRCLEQVGSIFAIATLISIPTGAASAQESSCGNCCKKMQRLEKIQPPISTPSSSYLPGYIRDK